MDQKKNWSRMGVSLYWESLENQSLGCDKVILIYVFSTRKTSLVIKIRAQRKKLQCGRGPRQKPCAVNAFSPFQLLFFLLLFPNISVC